MKFKVGDIVIGNKEASNNYYITKEGFLALVKGTDGRFIIIKPYLNDEIYRDDVEFYVSPTCFELYNKIF